jgi:hypothetical protein
MNDQRDTNDETTTAEAKKAPYHTPEAVDLGDAVAETRGSTSGARRDFAGYTFRR